MPTKNFSEWVEDVWGDEEAESADVVRKIETELFPALETGAVRAVDADFQPVVWVKKAVLLYFKHKTSEPSPYGPWRDKIALQACGDGRRVTPGSWVRRGCYIGENAVVLSGFVNIGAYIGAKTMVDTYASVGSCAQIGERCHLSAGVVVAGVLEPVQDAPVVVGDGCFFGAQTVVSEGVRVGDFCVLGAGVVLSQSTKIIDRDTGETLPKGLVPSGSVLVPGSYATTHGLSVQCAVRIRTLSEPMQKAQINELLRVF